MEIQILSDLHLDHHVDRGDEFLASINPAAKTIIIAGDLCNPTRFDMVAKVLCSKFEHVIYVIGNHEYYNRSREEVLTAIRAVNISNFHWLENDIIEIGGKRFLGTTLWFPRDDKAPKYFMNDFILIRDFKNWVYEANKQAVNFLTKELKAGDIVITHHMPSWDCVSERYIGDCLNPFFVCDVKYLIEERKPKLWVFGHTHDCKDLVIKDTRLVCNPVGYPREGCKFNPSLVMGI